MNENNSRKMTFTNMHHQQQQHTPRESVEQCERELSDSELKDITGGSNNEALSTLVNAVQKGGLVDTLNNAKDITVFASVEQ